MAQIIAINIKESIRITTNKMIIKIDKNQLKK
jgi:hypothetical protein